MARACPSSSGREAGTNLHRTPFYQGALTPTATQKATAETCKLPSPTHLCAVEGNQRTKRRPTQTWGGHAKSTLTVAPAENRVFLTNVNNETMLNEQILLRTCYCERKYKQALAVVMYYLQFCNSIVQLTEKNPKIKIIVCYVKMENDYFIKVILVIKVYN